MDRCKNKMARHSLLQALHFLVLIVYSASVSIPPKITEQSPIDIFYKDGETVKILCKASGSPTPSYTWKRADEDFEPAGNEARVVKLVDEGTIIINSPEDKDEGFYQCFATNEFGVAASNKFNLRQSKLKEFKLTAEQTFTPRLGEHQELKCPSPDSVPDAEIYWTSDTEILHWDDRVTVDYDDNLHFTHITEKDENCYHCVAYNKVMRKNVNGPLQCIKPSGRSKGTLKLAWPIDRSDQFGLVGDTLKLKCIWAADPTPNVYWYRDDGKDFDFSRVERGKSGGQELVINDLKLEDQGGYICYASSEDSRSEMYFNLKVESKPTWISKPEDVTTSVGGKAIFECSGEGIPNVKVDWFINGKKLEDALRNDKRLDSDHFLSLDNRLYFENLRLTDSLVVQCNVTNNNGFLYAEAFLNVLAEKPDILKEPNSTKVAEGTPFQLDCEVFGKPDPIVTWYKDNLQVTGGRFVVLDSGSLVITSAVLSDAGYYLCHASNIHGEVQRGAVVTVRRKTVIEMAPMDLEVTTGTNAKFTCSGTTDPQEVQSLTTSWLKDGKPVELGTRMFINYQDSSLTISGTEQRDTGTYECVVSNGLDNDTSSATLVVTDFPFRSEHVEILNNCANDKEAELEWIPGVFNNAPIQYFIVEYVTSIYPNHWVYAKQVNYTEVKAFIPLAPGLEYSFRVTSYNKIGPSPASEPTKERCATKPAPPSQNPRNVRTIGDMPGKLHIEWTPVPPEHQGGDGFIYVLKILKVGEAQKSELSITITDWTRQTYIIDSGAQSYVPYRIGISSSNNAGNSTENSPSIIGHSSEGMPIVTPSNLQVLEFDSEYVTLQWDFDRSEIGKTGSLIKGEFMGFKVQIWESNRRAESIIDINLLPEVLNMNSTENTFKARVRHLKPNMRLEARVSVVNHFYVSAPSEITTFDSPPGLPGPVSYLDDMNVGDNHVNLEWRSPLDNRGDLIGFDIGYQEVDGLQLGQLQERIPQIDDPFTTNGVLGGLKPNTKYRIFVWARTEAGRGEPYFIERQTAKPGVPLLPRFTISNVGHNYINVTWWKDAFQDTGNVVFVEYKKKDGREWISTSPESSNTWSTLRYLQPGIKYSVRIVVTNGVDIRRLSQTEDVETAGAAKAYDVSENLGWFLATIFSIFLQILLLILLCYCYNKGFRFKPSATTAVAASYSDRGYTYSDKAEFPRTSSDFQDPRGYNNDYYKDGDGLAYEDQRDGQTDEDDDYGRHRYGDEDMALGYDDNEDERFRDPSNRDNKGDNRENYDSEGYHPYNDDVDQDYDPNWRRRDPRDDEEYEDYDMDRRYPAEVSGRAPANYYSDSPSDREPGLRTEGYRQERPREVRSRDQPPSSYHSDRDSEREREPGLRQEGYRNEWPRETRRDEQPPGAYGGEPRDRYREPGLRQEGYKSEQPGDARRHDDDRYGRGSRSSPDEDRYRQRDRRYDSDSHGTLI